MPDQDEYENFNIEQHLREAKVNGNQNRVSQILQADASIKSQACWFDISKLTVYFNISTLQWCQLESLQVLFYEAKVPSSDGYSTI